MKKLTSISLALLAALASTAALAQANAQLPIGVTPRPTGSPPQLPPGLYVAVVDGSINVTNKGGAQTFTAGQFGYTSTPIQAPVIVPKNPGLTFALPATFSQSHSPTGSTTGPKAGAVDCIVR